MGDLELWGGPECTVNRVGTKFRDQLRESGHHDRLSDLDKFAALGLRAIRYPILWERVAPDDPTDRDWRWPDERLMRLRELQLRPIVGLVHHGSGPHYTDLLSDTFATGLADHAAAVARRYPWIEEWTPVNEPVTTARFSALYGHWHPHLRDERAFWLALLNQIDGVRLAMRAIRAEIPHAKLLQTDDLGRTYATTEVRDQAAFDNVRRWMSWDLLCARVVPGHALWRRLCGYGFEDRLRAMADAPCPPDTIGVNHYLTSDRFLDHRVRNYPAHLRGGNAKGHYADTEAVRVLQPAPPGLEGVLREAWNRYRIPIAVTEAHNGCTREEQMRWMAEAWATAGRLRGEGMDVRAVTAWALLGSCGWDTLLTRLGSYEPGVYDVREGNARPTALVDLLQRLASDRPLPPAATGQGWWRRPIRFDRMPVPRPAPLRAHIGVRGSETRARPILLAGLAQSSRDILTRCCDGRSLAYCLTDQGQESAAADGAAGRPWAMIHSGRMNSDWIARTCVRFGIASRRCPDRLDALAASQLLDEIVDAGHGAAPLQRVAAG